MKIEGNWAREGIGEEANNEASDREQDEPGDGHENTYNGTPKFELLKLALYTEI